MARVRPRGGRNGRLLRARLARRGTHLAETSSGGELVTLEITVLLILVTVYLLQRLARSGFVSHRVRRQWRVAWAHVRRAPRWALGAGALLTVVSLAARALILPALAWGLPDVRRSRRCSSARSRCSMRP